jgi:hypothetical protein
MILRSSILLALASSSCYSFSPLSTTRQMKESGHRSSSRLFDSEQSTPWDAQNWSVEYSGNAATASSKGAPKNLLGKSNTAAKLGKKQMEYNAVTNSDGLVDPGQTKRKVRASVKETGYDSMKNYIKSMCNHDLLNKNEEIILAREIQILLKWEQERELLEQQLLRCVFWCAARHYI